MLQISTREAVLMQRRLKNECKSTLFQLCSYQASFHNFLVFDSSFCLRDHKRHRGRTKQEKTKQTFIEPSHCKSTTKLDMLFVSFMTVLTFISHDHTNTHERVKSFPLLYSSYCKKQKRSSKQEEEKSWSSYFHISILHIKKKLCPFKLF